MQEKTERFGANMMTNHIQLIRSDQSKHGMIYTEL